MVKKIYMALLLGLLSGIQMQGAATGEPRGQKRKHAQAQLGGGELEGGQAVVETEPENIVAADAAAGLVALAGRTEDGGVLNFLVGINRILRTYEGFDCEKANFIVDSTFLEKLKHAAEAENILVTPGYKNNSGLLFVASSNIAKEYYHLRESDATKEEIKDALCNRRFSRKSMVTYPEFVAVKMHKVLQEQCKEMNPSMTLEEYSQNRKAIVGQLYNLLLKNFFHTFSAYYCDNEYGRHLAPRIVQHCNQMFDSFLKVHKSKLFSGNSKLAEALIVDLQNILRFFISLGAMKEVQSHVSSIIRLQNFKERYGQSCIDSFFTPENFAKYQILEKLKQWYSCETAQKAVLGEIIAGQVVPSADGGAAVVPAQIARSKEADLAERRADVLGAVTTSLDTSERSELNSVVQQTLKKINEPWKVKYVKIGSQAAKTLENLQILNCQSNKQVMKTVQALEEKYAGQEGVEEKIALDLINEVFTHFGVFNLRMTQKRTVTQFYFTHMHIPFPKDASSKDYSLVKHVYKDLADIICVGKTSIRNMIFEKMDSCNVQDDDAANFFGAENFNAMQVKEVLFNRYLKFKKKQYSGPINFSSFVYGQGGAPVPAQGAAPAQASQSSVYDDVDYDFDETDHSDDETESE